MRSMIKILTLSLLIGFLFSTAYATKFIDYSSETVLDSVYDDDIFLTGNEIRFNSKVSGDFFVFAAEIVQSKEVGGGFNAFAYSIQALNDIGGSFRGFGNSVTLNASIERNALIFGNKVTIGPESVIGRDLEVFCNTITFDGTSKGDLHLYSHNITISGTIDGDLNIKMDSSDPDAEIIIGPQTVIKGDLVYSSPVKADIDESAIINGNIKWDELELEKGSGRDLSPGKFLAWIISLKGYLIINILITMTFLIFALIPFPTPLWIIGVSIMFLISGNIILALTKDKANQFESVLDKQLLPSMGVGFVIFFLTPIAIIISIIAIPLAFVLTLIFGIATFFGSVYVVLFLGRKFLKLLGIEASSKPGYLYFSVGTIIFALLASIPYLGWLISILLYITGLGGLYLCYLKRKELRNTQ